MNPSQQRVQLVDGGVTFSLLKEIVEKHNNIELAKPPNVRLRFLKRLPTLEECSTTQSLSFL
jgi:hypothetical protein